MNESKKLLFIATRQFWPTSTGKEITLYYNCKGLFEKFGYEIHLLCFSNKNTDKTLKKPDFIHEVRYVDVPSIGHALMNGGFSGLLKGWPLQNVMFYSKQIDSFIQSYYRTVKPSVVFFDMIRLVPYATNFKNETVKKILIEDDFLAKRYQRQMKSQGGNISGYMSGNISGGINRLISMQWLRNLILLIESKRLLKYEQCSPNLFDHITFISPVEARDYNNMYHTDKAITLTMGAEIKYLADKAADKIDTNTLTIVGNFSYAPNAASLQWIDRHVLPLLSDNIQYNVIGRCPDELKQTITSKRINFLGFVHDIRPVVKSAAVYFSPICFGTGIKTKIVEAMAMGMPVVTNSVGAEGLDVQHGRELFIAETAEDMADIVKRLMADEELRKRVGECGQRFVARHHDWDVVYKAFETMGL